VVNSHHKSFFLEIMGATLLLHTMRAACPKIHKMNLLQFPYEIQLKICKYLDSFDICKYLELLYGNEFTEGIKRFQAQTELPTWRIRGKAEKTFLYIPDQWEYEDVPGINQFALRFGGYMDIMVMLDFPYQIEEGDSEFLPSIGVWCVYLSSEIQDMVEALTCANTQITRLTWEGSCLKNEEIFLLAEALKNQNCRLEFLDVESNLIEDAGILAIASALSSRNCRLTTLAVGFNLFGTEGAQGLASALTTAECQLKRLMLIGTSIGLDGVVAIANALVHVNCKLTELSFHCESGDECVPALVRAFKSKNFKLRELNLGDSEFSESNCELLKAHVLATNCRLYYHCFSDGQKQLVLVSRESDK
jgi:hypothetical protein